MPICAHFSRDWLARVGVKWAVNWADFEIFSPVRANWMAIEPLPIPCRRVETNFWNRTIIFSNRARRNVFPMADVEQWRLEENWAAKLNSWLSDVYSTDESSSKCNFMQLPTWTRNAAQYVRIVSINHFSRELPCQLHTFRARGSRNRQETICSRSICLLFATDKTIHHTFQKFNHHRTL